MSYGESGSNGEQDTPRAAMVAGRDSYCPGCDGARLNLVTGLCEDCGDDYTEIERPRVRALQEAGRSGGPLRARLAAAVGVAPGAPLPCLCGGGVRGHTSDCPASRSAYRYLEHVPRIERQPPAGRPGASLSPGDVAFVADLRSAIGDALAKGRQRCPECDQVLKLSGGVLRCEPCGVVLIPPPGYPAPDTVWTCEACDRRWAYRDDPVTRPCVLEPNEPAPTVCPTCGGPLARWRVTRVERGPNAQVICDYLRELFEARQWGNGG